MPQGRILGSLYLSRRAGVYLGHYSDYIDKHLIFTRFSGAISITWLVAFLHVGTIALIASLLSENNIFLSQHTLQCTFRHHDFSVGHNFDKFYKSFIDLFIHKTVWFFRLENIEMALFLILPLFVHARLAKHTPVHYSLFRPGLHCRYIWGWVSPLWCSTYWGIL